MDKSPVFTRFAFTNIENPKGRKTKMKSISRKMKRNLILAIPVFAIGIIINFTQPANSSVTGINKVNEASLITFVQDDKPGENEIWMKDLAFVPKIKKIAVGTKITWINKETAMHTVVSGTEEKPTKMFHSKNLGKGGKFSFTFKKKGVYKYYCSTHENMNGVIIVK